MTGFSKAQMPIRTVVGVAVVGMLGFVAVTMIASPFGDVQKITQEKTDTAQCDVWRTRSRTAGLPETDRWEKKFNKNDCSKSTLDELAGGTEPSDADEGGSEPDTGFWPGWEETEEYLTG